jgi:UDP-N-acetylglucosamine 1-carboxyvinyltransferase
MSEYLIEGGVPIGGTIRASGNKNAALPCIAAAILSEETVVLRNVPDIEDVQVMLDIFTALGGRVERPEGKRKGASHLLPDTKAAQ